MNRYAVVQEIQQRAADVTVGDSIRMVCPHCNGGSTHESSMSIKRYNETTAGFICYRANCDLGSGRVALFEEDGKLLTAKSDAISKERPEPSLYSLSQDAVDLLMNKYHMTENHIRYAGIRLTYDQRIAVPLNGPYRERPGILIKKEKELYRGTREYSTIPAKWLYIRGDKSNLASWYRAYRHNKKNSSTLVVVEDVLSAVRLSDFTDSVALLGTYMLRGVIADIKRQGYEKVFIALDNDATKKAFNLVRRLSSELPVSVMYLERDIKGMKHAELTKLMKHYEVI